ncbi:AI-2E family transporter [Adhaeribacter rhizoryzae]|uniref:AI-2E family transporter n=1 Tax=Adhaeribacter rhizoryzae TaxID=2607907 RepID=A0A5M6D7J9_9BACT|nr:AI-2E family transporter [Adhaeribacter rhizoryzae]KAA5543528.1 AI-2E family transporter [Adhaeribacter rhizoryzae]
MRSISIYRANAVVLFGILVFYALYHARVFLIPLFFAILLAMLMVPISRKLESWGINRILATLICILIFLLFIAGIFGIIAAQAVSLSEDLPQIQQKFQQMVDWVQRWIEGQFGVTPQRQIQIMKTQVGKFLSSPGKYVSTTLSGFMGIVTGFVLVLLYFFFLMWKREKYEEFFLKLVVKENEPTVRKELQEINQVASQYLIGRLISMLFLAVFYGIGFTVVGLKNGLLLSLIAVIPTIIPYIGSIIGGFFPLMMALVTGSPGTFLPVVIILVLAQVLDNNIIEPIVEGQSLDISPIFTIVAIVIGELTWGLAGVILFVPLFAVLKIICDHVPSLHPYAFLLNNETEEPAWVEKIKGWFKKK